MSDPETNVILVREESISELKSFVEALIGILGRCGDRQKRLLFAMRAGMMGECIHCGIRVTGAELMALGDDSPWGETSAHIQRLREGHCANDACGFSRYRILFYRRADLNWGRVFTLIKILNEEQLQVEAAAEQATLRSRRLWRCLRAVSLVVLVLLLVLVRQWYVGGRIPLIREPEAFHVDPLPIAEEKNY